jgi:phenylacetate-coenzyme A ligase PaaK-like adenylate-forming protein
VASYVEAARQQWAEGNRRLSAEASNTVAYETLMEQVEAVTEELRRRIGEHFTIAQLADAYGSADAWVLEAVAERAERPGWQGNLSVAQDAAFHLYARGATDYKP